jgi:hypothetical protein
MHNLVGDILTSLPDILNDLNDDNIYGSNFKLMEVLGVNGNENKALMNVFSNNLTRPHKSSCTLTEIEEVRNVVGDTATNAVSAPAYVIPPEISAVSANVLSYDPMDDLMHLI